MKKLELRLENLSVDTFEMVVNPAAQMGTVRALHSHNQADSACWGTGCNQSMGEDQCGGNTQDRSCGLNSDCCTYTQGNDDTCINCTAHIVNCTGDPYFCYVVSEGTCWTQSGCC
jgi:hypothetical protein